MRSRPGSVAASPVGAQAAEPPAAAPPAAAAAYAAADTLAPRRLPSSELFAGAREVKIVHHEHVYRLRQTALGKLILTK